MSWTVTDRGDRYALGASPYAYAVLGARYGASGNFKLAAMGDYDAVFASRRWLRYSAYYNSGTYWYFYSGRSMGFAPSSSVSLNYWDVYSYYDSTRMSWKLDGYSGGRAGSISDSTSGLYKVVMYCN